MRLHAQATSPSCSMPTLSAFSALCQHSVAASLWAAPASTRIDLKDLEGEVSRATNLDTLADIGLQALDPVARRTRGHEPQVCERAWQLWSSVEWVLANTNDGALIGTYQNGSRLDAQLDRADQALLQFQFAKALLLALAQPQDAVALHDRVAHCFVRFEQQVLDWAKTHNPQVLHRIDRPQRESLLHQNRSVLADRVPPQDNLGRTTSLLATVLGHEQLRALTQWVQQARPNPSSGSPEAGEAAAIPHAHSIATAADEESTFRSFCRGLQHERWMEKRYSRPLYRASLSASVRQGQMYVDQFLSPEQQSLGGLAQFVADHFGFRSVSVFPVGGAQRARQELLLACEAFSRLAANTQLPPAAIGLGGMKLRLALSKRSNQRGDLAFFGEPSSFFGAQTRRLPGTMSFCSPLTAVEHEWTHAWDHQLRNPHTTLSSNANANANANAGPDPLPLSSNAKGNTKTDPIPLSDAKALLQQAAEFHTPVPAHTKRKFVRSFERPLFSRLISLLGKNEDESWSSFFLQAGNAQTQALAEKGGIPPSFKRDCLAVRDAVRNGSEKTLVRTLLALMELLDTPWGAETPKERQKEARLVAQFILQERWFLRNATENSQRRPDAGPFVWAATLSDQRNKTNYWITPSEKLARACETILGADSLVALDELRWPGPEADLPEFQLAVANENALSFYSLPREDEQARFSVAFHAFFEQTRPAFEQLAKERGGPSLDLSQPIQDHLEQHSSVRLDSGVPALVAMEHSGSLALRNLHDFRQKAQRAPVSESTKPAIS